MKRYFLLLLLSFFISVSFAQRSLIDSMSNSLCEAIQQIDKPLTELTQVEAEDLIQKVKYDYFAEWSKIEVLMDEDGNEQVWRWERYLNHMTQLKCPDFRIVENKFDQSRYVKELEQTLHFRSKEILGYLEDNVASDTILQEWIPSLQNDSIKAFIEAIQFSIDSIETETLVSYMPSPFNKYAFSILFVDLDNLDNRAIILVTFDDAPGHQIKSISYKNSLVLDREKKRFESLEFIEMKDGTKIPPPPPIGN